MPTYLYQLDTGEQKEVFQRMSEEPLTEIDGVPCQRVPCVGTGQVSMGPLGQGSRYPYVSNALPPTLRGCKNVKQNGRLKPLIESPRHEREVMAKNNLVKESAAIDED